MEEINNSIQMLIQGGAVGIAILLVLYTGWKDKLYNTTMNQHLKHFTDAFDRSTEAIRKNTGINAENKEINHRTCKLLDRIEHNLDKNQ